MTPKSLLRLPAATSTIDQLTGGGFQPVIDDQSYGTGSGSDRVAGHNDEARPGVQRIVLCSGKVYYDLADAHEEQVARGARKSATLTTSRSRRYPSVSNSSTRSRVSCCAN